MCVGDRLDIICLHYINYNNSIFFQRDLMGASVWCVGGVDIIKLHSKYIPLNVACSYQSACGPLCVSFITLSKIAIN